MAVRIEMPKLSDTMEEGVIAKWNVSEGDKVESGDVIAEVETDKATMDVEIFDGGTVLKIMAEEGDAVPLGNTMAIIGEEGEDISDLLEESGGASSKSEAPAEEEEPGEEKEEYDPLFGDLKEAGNGADRKVQTPAGKDDEGRRIIASPLARRMAEDRGIDLANVEGSGPRGRIIKHDIETYEPEPAAAEAPAAKAPVESRESKDVRVSQMRKTIARRLAESKFSNPHYYETIDIDMERAIEARNSLNEISEVKISFNDLVVKAASVALKQHPYVNSSWLEDTIRLHGDVHVAVAVAVEEGLVTPVIRNSDLKGISTISKETKELAELARDRKLQPEQMEGSTFTISNLGMFGIEEFTAIINPPNVCILAVGGIRDVPVVKDGEVVPGKRMKVTLSSDHRVVDGAKAAEFLNTFRDLLENPMGMLL